MFTKPEIAHILVGLRTWQMSRPGSKTTYAKRTEAEKVEAICGILNEGGRLLSDEEIDQLCERINTTPNLFGIDIYMEGGCIQGIECRTPELIRVRVIDEDSPDGEDFHVDPMDEAEEEDKAA